MVRSINLGEVRELAFVLAKKHLEWDEPIPSFKTRNPQILESCLIVPFQVFDKKELYRGLTRKAAVLFYLMIKNHPFQNGNKRIAVTTLLVFLAKNGKWIKVDNREFYNFAKWVAESNSKLKDEVINAIKSFIEKHISS